jgi:hypothetical protein
MLRRQDEGNVIPPLDWRPPAERCARKCLADDPHDQERQHKSNAGWPTVWVWVLVAPLICSYTLRWTGP